MSKSIIYISANREPEKVMNICLESIAFAPLSIISVTQKPVDLGHNICVGDIGQAHNHIFLQMYIGCKNTLADTVYWCESDTLYPPEHFAFEPSDSKAIYFNTNIYRWYKEHYIKKKRPSVCSLVANRKHLLKALRYILFESGGRNKDWKIRFNQQHFTTNQPIINIYHPNGLHKRLSAVEGKMKHRIPYWPKASVLLKGDKNGSI